MEKIKFFVKMIFDMLAAISAAAGAAGWPIRAHVLNQPATITSRREAKYYFLLIPCYNAPFSFCSPFSMLRTYAARSAARLGRHAAPRRALSTTGSRAADVRLTVDGKEVSIEGISSSAEERETLSNSCFSWICSYPSMRESRRDDTAVLLPRKTHDCGQLSYVPGGGRTGA